MNRQWMEGQQTVSFTSKATAGTSAVKPMAGFFNRRINFKFKEGVTMSRSKCLESRWTRTTRARASTATSTAAKFPDVHLPRIFHVRDVIRLFDPPGWKVC